MCSVGEMMSCEISFIPIQSDDYIADVDKVLDIIKAYGMEHTVGLLSTTIRGKKGRILRMIEDIYDSMNIACRFVIDIKLSNLCGCEL